MPISPETSRGNLKVYLGYAAGVGKTFQMLADAHASAQRGVDVVDQLFTQGHIVVRVLTVTR